MLVRRYGYLHNAAPMWFTACLASTGFSVDRRFALRLETAISKIILGSNSVRPTRNEGLDVDTVSPWQELLLKLRTVVLQ